MVWSCYTRKSAKKKDKYPCKQTTAVFDDVDAVDDDDESMNE